MSQSPMNQPDGGARPADAPLPPRRLRRRARRQSLLARLIARQRALQTQLSAAIAEARRSHEAGVRLDALRGELSAMAARIDAELKRRRDMREKSRNPSVRRIGRREVEVH